MVEVDEKGPMYEPCPGVELDKSWLGSISGGGGGGGGRRGRGGGRR